MAPKKKNQKKNQQTKKEDDFDLDAFLEAEGITNQEPVAKEEPAKEEPKPIQIEDFANVDDAAAAFLNSLGSSAPASGGKKKNKKKKAAAAQPAAEGDATAQPAAEGAQGGKKKKGKKDAAPKISAHALKIQAELERKRKIEEEKRRIAEEERRLQEEEERKIREEEERIAAIKQKKKDEKKAKIEQMKREGTYRTKKQKQKEAENRRQVEMMRALYSEQQAAIEEEKEEEEKEVEEPEAEAEAKAKQEAEAKAKAEQAQDQEEEILDDWENEEVDEADILDSWEDAEIEESKISPPVDSPIDIKSSEPVETKPVKLTKTQKRQLEQQKKEEEQKQRELERKKEEELMSTLRSPICVIMGHVDTGKTSLLDKIRHTSIQKDEAGGITQQIGATYFPIQNIKESTEKLKKELELEYKVPGLLVIDTPGHECFHNLRSRGSNLCDIAILVVDIMHLLEPQTIESLNMLKQRRCPFVVALNKVDRLYDWKPRKNSPFRHSLNLQAAHTQEEFRTRTEQTITAFNEQGLNAALYYENDDPKNVVSLVPTSAVTGEGIPDLLALLVKLSQQYMQKRLVITDDVKASVLEKKVIDGLGTTLDVILVDGKLTVGDTIVLCGMNGPVVTQIKALKTPQPMRELRTKTMFIDHDEIRAAMGMKVVAQNLDDAVAGTSLIVCNNPDDLEHAKMLAQDEIESVRKLLKIDGEGVYVQTSTLGSLEALLEFLSTLDPPIPVGAFNIGPVHKRDVIQASVMLEKKKEFATILAFDVKIVPEAAAYAKEIGVQIFSADILYNLFDHFTAYVKALADEKREASKEEAIFPCILKIIPQYIFNRCNPIVVGVDVVEGILKPGTPLCVVIRKTTEVKREKKMTLEDWMPDDNEDINVDFKDSKKSKNLGHTIEKVESVSYLDIGIVKSIQLDSKEVPSARPGKAVSISIEPRGDKPVLLGRQFTESDLMYSHLSRRSINSLKENFQKEMTDDDWRLVIRLKGIQNIK